MNTYENKRLIKRERQEIAWRERERYSYSATTSWVHALFHPQGFGVSLKPGDLLWERS